ncbi:hypothetical protein ACWIUD_02715 [Helicobacter sp. 23-1044]
MTFSNSTFFTSSFLSAFSSHFYTNIGIRFYETPIDSAIQSESKKDSAIQGEFQISAIQSIFKNTKSPPPLQLNSHLFSPRHAQTSFKGVAMR